jgi:hypothetical protein
MKFDMNLSSKVKNILWMVRRLPRTPTQHTAIRNDFRPGEGVEVLSAAEIFQTLDSNGTLDGLPFMPEMLEYCGQQFRINRRAEKTCVECSGGYDFREFHWNDVFLLDGLRCSGVNHGGCQRGCLIFWKGAWLKKTGSNGLTVPVSLPSLEQKARLKTISAPGRYFCQSTELLRSTNSLPRSRRLWKCISEVRSGAVSLNQMLRMVVIPLSRKLLRKFARTKLVGPLTRTPTQSLALQSGDEVEIKSLEEIKQTLDQRGRNRGLVCDALLCTLRGKKYRVRNRLDRMILESTGEMRNMENTVILEDITCFCNNSIGGCPRQDFVYWREIWLERVT